MRYLITICLLLLALQGMAATATYKPNSSNCMAYHEPCGWEETEAPPDSLASVCSFEFWSDDLNTMSTDDENSVSSGMDGGLLAGHRFKFKVVEDVGTITKLKFTHKGYTRTAAMINPDCGVMDQIYSGVIYLWDEQNSAWELGLSITDSSKATRAIEATSSISDYVDASGYVWCLVMTEDYNPDLCGAQGNVYTYYAELEVTYTEAATGQVIVAGGEQ